jgi:hypothetical protein
MAREEAQALPAENDAVDVEERSTRRHGWRVHVSTVTQTRQGCAVADYARPERAAPGADEVLSRMNSDLVSLAEGSPSRTRAAATTLFDELEEAGALLARRGWSSSTAPLWGTPGDAGTS